MNLTRIEIEQFRSYDRLELHLPPQGLRIAGRNGSGKTSLLEAVVLLSTTRSPRTVADRELVRWESGVDLGIAAYTRIVANVETIRGPRTLSIGIELDETRTSLLRKIYQVNGENRRAQEVVGILTCVLFSPEDVVLVTGAPALRRREIDILISQTDRTYLKALTSYGKVLAQRNQLLRQFSRERRSARDPGAVAEISFWDEQLVGYGSLVVSYRAIVAAELGDRVRHRSSALIEGPEIGFGYQPRVELPALERPVDPAGYSGTVAAAFDRQLASRRDQEFRRGMSLVGPHRDDFPFLIDERELAAFGSRGQQRLGVVAFKMASIDVISDRTGDRPVLLLDDVLSELDAGHRARLLDDLAQCGCQVLVTSTDIDLLDQPALASLPMMEVVDGAVTPVER